MLDLNTAQLLEQLADWLEKGQQSQQRLGSQLRWSCTHDTKHFIPLLYMLLYTTTPAHIAVLCLNASSYMTAC